MVSVVAARGVGQRRSISRWWSGGGRSVVTVRGVAGKGHRLRAWTRLSSANVEDTWLRGERLEREGV